jgi:hypothetical protein
MYKNVASKSLLKVQCLFKQLKTLFLYCQQIKLLSVATSARRVVISKRTAQNWTKRLKEYISGTFTKKKLTESTENHHSCKMSTNIILF